MQRTLSTLAVVALVVLAGCAGLTGDPADGEVDETDLPPGVTQSGVENASALVDAHAAALAGSGFEHTLDTNYTARTAAGNQSLDTAQHAVARPNLTTYRVTVKRDVMVRDEAAPGVHTEVWGNESVALVKLTRGNQTVYRRASPDSPTFDATQFTTFAGSLEAYLRLGNYSVERADRGDDGTHVTLNATDLDETANASASGIDANNVSAYAGEAVVADDGRIQSLDVEMDVETGAGNATVQVDYRLQRTGDVTVEEPGWLATAQNRTTNR